jgi:hypothetical protein
MSKAIHEAFLVSWRKESNHWSTQIFVLGSFRNYYGEVWQMISHIIQQISAFYPETPSKIFTLIIIDVVNQIC